MVVSVIGSGFFDCDFALVAMSFLRDLWLLSFDVLFRKLYANLSTSFSKLSCLHFRGHVFNASTFRGYRFSVWQI